jgi:hypothetical protein
MPLYKDIEEACANTSRMDTLPLRYLATVTRVLVYFGNKIKKEKKDIIA